VVRGVAASARVDYAATVGALGVIRCALTPSSYQGWQDTLSESTGLSARNETGIRRTTSDRTRWRTGMSNRSDPLADLWDNS